jgi:hypothetical protein
MTAPDPAEELAEAPGGNWLLFSISNQIDRPHRVPSPDVRMRRRGAVVELSGTSAGFLMGTRIHELSWRRSKSTNSALKTESVKAETEAHLRTAHYLRSHHGEGRLRAAAQVPA